MSVETEIISNILKKLVAKKSPITIDNIIKESLSNKNIVSEVLKDSLDQVTTLVTVKKTRELVSLVEKELKAKINQSKVIQSSILTIQGITKK